MKPLNVRFTDETKKHISDTAIRMDLFDSCVARAALNIGLNKINEMQDLVISDWDMTVYELVVSNQ